MIIVAVHLVGVEPVIRIMQPGYIRVSAHRVGRDVAGAGRAVTRAGEVAWLVLLDAVRGGADGD